MPVPDRQTDRQTNEHHGNTATIRSNERTHRALETVVALLTDMLAHDQSIIYM